MGKFVDLTGKRFGRLVVNDLYDRNNGVIRYECICDCGNQTVVRASNLRSGHTKSCGCFHDDSSSEKGTERHYRTHSMTGTRLYRIWHGMKSRCYNPNVQYYCYYGSKGVGMCEEWKSHFEQFYQWAISNGYDDGLSIDRIDSNGDYCPENCRWATPIEQQANRINTPRLTCHGVTKTLSEWAAETGIKRNTIRERLNRGWSVEKSLTEPVKSECYANNKSLQEPR